MMWSITDLFCLPPTFFWTLLRTQIWWPTPPWWSGGLMFHGASLQHFELAVVFTICGIFPLSPVVAAFSVVWEFVSVMWMLTHHHMWVCTIRPPANPQSNSLKFWLIHPRPTSCSLHRLWSACGPNHRKTVTQRCGVKRPLLESWALYKLSEYLKSSQHFDVFLYELNARDVEWPELFISGLLNWYHVYRLPAFMV